MISYINSLCSETREYLKILEPNFPDFLEEYISAPELQRIDKISMFCGKDYSTSFGVRYPISNLAHSVGVALIIWHFTHSKKQTLAGLFHDISTPVFKHCIDFMNGDALSQESTEERTEDIIKNSKHIMNLLKRDGIRLSEVADYKIYPLADNNAPMLSADRVEYNFSCGLSLKRVFDLGEVKEIYNHLIIGFNEQNSPEFAFDSIEIAEKYIKKLSELWPEWCNEQNNVYMQFLADICSSVSKIGRLSIDDLYKLSEKEVLEKIKNCGDSYLETRMKMFQTHKTITVCETPKKDKYSVRLKSKRRYVSPLVKTKNGFERAEKISPLVKDLIDEYLNKKFDKYGCLDFNFVPYK